MARIYHDEHNQRGERALVWIVCDDCGKKAKPGDPEMLETWVKLGFYYSPGDPRIRRIGRSEWIYCGTCKQEHT